MNTGVPSISAVLLDAWRRLRRPIVPTIISALIVFSATVTIFSTTGLATASQQRALERINSPAGRLITVSDPNSSAGLSADNVGILSRLSGVEWVSAISPVNDTRDSHEVIPARAIFGRIPPPVRITDGRNLDVGQALAGPGITQRLGLISGVGTVRGGFGTAEVVGSFVADDPLGLLNHNILIRSDAATKARPVMTIWVSVDSVKNLPVVRDAVRQSIRADKIQDVHISTSEELASLSEDVANEMANNARLTLTGLLAGVALLIGAVQFGRVSSMAKDIGRRRALGASRHLIVAQVLLNAALTTVFGAVAGVMAGLIVTWVVAKALPPWDFTLAVSILMVLGSLAGTLIPAIRAAHLDPVRILRVP